MHSLQFIRTSLLAFSLIFWSAVSADNLATDFNYQGAQDQIDKARTLVAMARQHEHAEGMPRSYSRAVEFYCQAASLGYDEAQYALGWMYANGRGVTRDDSIAAHLFNMAAEQGHTHAGKMIRYMSISQDPALPECLQPFAQSSTVDYSNKPFFDLVQKLAPQYNLDPNLVMAIITVESAFNVQAVSHKNAQGLMQLIPATAERFQVKNVFDAEENIRGGMAYLRWLLAFFKGDVVLAVAGYNAGEGAVERFQGIPPYAETKNYVKKIQAQYINSTHPYQPDIVHRHAMIAFSDYE